MFAWAETCCWNSFVLCAFGSLPTAFPSGLEGLPLCRARLLAVGSLRGRLLRSVVIPPSLSRDNSARLGFFSFVLLALPEFGHPPLRPTCLPVRNPARPRALSRSPPVVPSFNKMIATCLLEFTGLLGGAESVFSIKSGELSAVISSDVLPAPSSLTLPSGVPTTDLLAGLRVCHLKGCSCSRHLFFFLSAPQTGSCTLIWLQVH